MKRLAVFVSTAILLAVLPTLLVAGRESEYSDKYPHMTFIAEHEQSTWFAGYWSGRFLAVQYDSKQRWNTFSWTITGEFSLYQFRIEMQGHWVHFAGYNRSMYFDIQTGQWLSEKPNNVSSPPSGKAQDRNYRIDRNTVVVEQPDGESRYEFPSPSYNAYKRWRYPPQPHYWIQNDIGEYVQVGNSLWFVIDFYDGEGSTGIGGLGLFDLGTKEFGVLRHPFLVNCSTGIILSKGDTVLVATGGNFEYGLYGCNGLVLIDTKTGMIAQLDARNSPLDGDYFYAMNIVGDHLWMATDRAIVGWDLRNGTWVSARLESLIASDTATYYRKAITLGISSNGGILEARNPQLVPMGRVDRGQTVGYEWPSESLVEVQLRNTVTGWMPKQNYDFRENRAKEQLMYNTLTGTLFEDSSLTIPYHHVGFSSCKKITESKDAVKVSTPGFYVDLQKFQPLFSEQKTVTGFQPTWHNTIPSYESIKEHAIEGFQREQEEIRNNDPVYDTLLTINKKMDLYDSFSELLNCRWLPTGRFEPTEPTGIEFSFFGLGEGGDIKEMVFQTHSDSLWNENRNIAKGDTLEVAAGTFKGRFIVESFEISNDILDEITLRYTLWIFTPPRWEE